MRTSRTRIAAAGVTASALGLAVPALAASAQASPTLGRTWAATGTHALSLTHATRLGAAPGNAPLRLTLGLAGRHQAALTALIRAQSTPGTSSYRHFLTPAQFTNRFGATPAQAASVAAYLRSQGMRHVAVSANRLQVTASSSVGQAERAFHTSISRFSRGGRTVLANTAAAHVPATLAGRVTGVLGLNTLHASARPAATPGLPKLTGYYPDEFPTVYDAKGTKPGNGTTLAVIAQGNLTQTIKDLRAAEKKRGLPQVPVSLVYTGPRSPDTSGADEWDLDTQTSTGVAPYAKRLYVYVATSLTDADLSRSINAFVTQDVAKSGSASLGECDALASADGSTVVDDAAFAQAAAQGQTFFASTGDTGSSCAVAPTNGVPGSGPVDTEYPASSTYVVGVGGTTLDTDNSDAYQNEITWYGGGGGVSPIEYAGYWQSGVVPTAAAGLRGVPDVAFDADPNTGALILVNGQETQIGGTSLSSPLALGMWTRLEATHGNRLGFASPSLYGIYSKAQTNAPLPPTTVPAAFHDIVAGTNGLYTALPGYDYTTGLGSWDVDKLSAALK